MDTRPLTQKQREFAEKNHELVYVFLSQHELPEDTFYDVVIFGYLRAVQKYCDTPSLHRYRFSTIAWRHMRKSLSNYYKYLSRPKRNAPTVSFHEPADSAAGLLWEDVIHYQDERLAELETELLLHTLAASLPPREMRIIHMRIRGDRMHDIARAEHLSFRQINRLLANAYPIILSVLRG